MIKLIEPRVHGCSPPITVKWPYVLYWGLNAAGSDLEVPNLRCMVGSHVCNAKRSQGIKHFRVHMMFRNGPRRENVAHMDITEYRRVM